MKLIFIFIFILLSSNISMAQEDECLNDGSMRDMAVCQNIELKIKRAELEKVYKAALVLADEAAKDFFSSFNGYKPNTRACLEKSQEMWESFVDTDCDAVMEYNISGSGAYATVAHQGCLVEQTNIRIEFLKSNFLIE